MNRILLIIFVLLTSSFSVMPQHNGHHKDTIAPMKKDRAHPAEHNHQGKDTVPPVKMKEIHTVHDHLPGMKMEVPMSHAFSLNLPMTRNGSGTAWLPDASPMFGYMMHSRKWMYMLHGSIFLRYNNQDFTNKGSRGDDKADAPTWFMLMGQRKVGQKGLFHFSSMISLDPIIQGGNGYPLLFQTGETYKGKPLVDRQHPHDLFSELSISYSHAFSEKVDLFAYLAYPGEPAIGPVTFMHRPSSLDNPNAPITHHWVDATHITFGVTTLGLRLGNFKIEGSSFTGREPDENRYNFDRPRFDSWSGRVSVNPTSNWALQVSHGFIKNPEEIHVGEDVNRTTASAIYNSNNKRNRYFNATALWGLNKVKGNKGENAILVEAAWHVNKASVYGRYEHAQKSSEELILDEQLFGHHTLYGVNAFTAGFNYDILALRKIRLAAGGNYSIYHTPQKLDALYGKNPMAFQVYLRLYPEQMKM